MHSSVPSLVMMISKVANPILFFSFWVVSKKALYWLHFLGIENSPVRTLSLEPRHFRYQFKPEFFVILIGIAWSYIMNIPDLFVLIGTSPRQQPCFYMVKKSLLPLSLPRYEISSPFTILFIKKPLIPYLTFENDEVGALILNERTDCPSY